VLLIFSIFLLSHDMGKLVSAGLLMYREEPTLEFFIVHPGGPFFRNKEVGVWSIPKGLPDDGEDLLVAAIREFTEETGLQSTGPYFPLGTIQQKGGKTVHCWAFKGTWDPSTGIKSNTFKIEWPPRSGKFAEFPEQDKAAWMNIARAREALIAEQVPFIERLVAQIA
jgi:predicted NUDIX family NTP pyrophosphohydrolase